MSQNNRDQIGQNPSVAAFHPTQISRREAVYSVFGRGDAAVSTASLKIYWYGLSALDSIQVSRRHEITFIFPLVELRVSWYCPSILVMYCPRILVLYLPQYTGAVLPQYTGTVLPNRVILYCPSILAVSRSLSRGKRRIVFFPPACRACAKTHRGMPAEEAEVWSQPDESLVRQVPVNDFLWKACVSKGDKNKRKRQRWQGEEKAVVWRYSAKCA